MAADIFHEGEQLFALEQRTSVHGASGLVGGLLEADRIDDAVKLALRQAAPLKALRPLP